MKYLSTAEVAAVNISSLIDGISESAIPVVSPNAKDEVKIIYANIRGLRQGAAQLRHRVATFNPMFVLTETHIWMVTVSMQRCCHQAIESLLGRIGRNTEVEC